jgi:sorbitol-6-phosphate 2-dehydrogenase
MPCSVCEGKGGQGGLEVAIDLSGIDDELKAAEIVAKAIDSAKADPASVSLKCDDGTKQFAVYYTRIKGTRDDVVRGKVALVTGGAQGFGEQIVRGLIREGAYVYIADMNMKGAEALAADINRQSVKPAAWAVEVNVADEESVKKMFQFVAATTGGLDLCVSNAGVVRASSVLEQDIKTFTFVTNVNYIAFTIMSKHSALMMKKQYEASKAMGKPVYADIIQINSKSGLDGSNKNAAYAGSKFGGIGLVQSFAKELVVYNIKVNAICPGNFLGGPLWSDPEKGLFVQYFKNGKVPGAKSVQDVKDYYEGKVPMHRGCEGVDVLRALFYIVEQLYETGQAVPVTGGQVMLD